MECKICWREGKSCGDECIYRLFPNPQGEDELADLEVVDRIFTRKIFRRLLDELDREHVTEAMYSIIWEARKRSEDRIGGSYHAFLELERTRREASPAESAVGDSDEDAVVLSSMEAIKGCKKSKTLNTDVPCTASGANGLKTTGENTYEDAVVLSSMEAIKGCKKSETLNTDVPCTACGANGLKTTGENTYEVCTTCKGQWQEQSHEDTVIKVKGDYHKEGYDSHLTAELSVSEALLGGMAEISTPQGPVLVEIEPCAKELILKGKGAKRLDSRRGSSFGDLYVHFTVGLPAKLTDRQRELIKEFAKEEKLT